MRPTARTELRRPDGVSTLLGMASDPPARAHPPPSDAPGDEAALVARLRARDHDALAVLYDRHGASCYALARRVLVDEGLAQDAVQEAFIAAWRQADGYDGARGSLRTWLLTLTHRRAVDLVRRENRHRSRAETLDALESVPTPGASVEDEAGAGLRAGAVRRALGGLPYPQREALLLAYFGGYTQNEIARLTGSPLGTVKTRTFAGLRALRRALGPLAGDGAGDGAGGLAGEEVGPHG